MSAEHQGDVLIVPGTVQAGLGIGTKQDLEIAQRQADEARRQAVAIGDYATAEQWYDQERTLAGQLAAQDQQTTP